MKSRVGLIDYPSCRYSLMPSQDVANDMQVLSARGVYERVELLVFT